MMRSRLASRSVLFVAIFSLFVMTGLSGCTALRGTAVEPNTSGVREPDANWGSGYRSTNEWDKGTGLNRKGREIERSLGFQ